MLASKFRFRGHASVSRVRGRSLPFAFGRFVYVSNPKRHDPRVAVVVSKKTAKSAVVRNRIRRRVFEAIRTSRVLENHGVDVVVIVKDDTIVNESWESLFLQINKFCSKIID